MTLVVAFVMMLTRKSEDARLQRDAVAAIRSLGGTVYYDYQKSRPGVPNVFNPAAAPTAPVLVRRLLGEDWFHAVVMVSLRETDVVDEDLRHLERLSSLENVDLTGTAITSAGMEHLKSLKGLRCLVLWRTSIDDAGLKHLSGMTRLWQLILDETLVTDAGLASLEELTGLEDWLGLSNLLISDEGLKHLRGMTRLRNLTLRNTGVTPEGAAALHQALPRTEISIAPILQLDPNQKPGGGAIPDEGQTVVVRRQLTTLLRQQVGAVERICGLSDVQIRKLLLAGRGDLQRFLDRQRAKREGDRDAEGENRSSSASGPFGQGSLFIRTVEGSLSAEQTLTFAPFRNLFQRGVCVHVWPGAPAPITAIRLRGTEFSDQDFENLGDCAELRVIAVIGVRMTDAGLMQLKRVKGLQELWLTGTEISDTALAELQQELPGLKVKR